MALAVRGQIVELEAGLAARRLSAGWERAGAAVSYFRWLRSAGSPGLLGWIKARVGDDPVADRAAPAGGAQVAEVAAPQSGQAGRADRQRDGAEPDSGSADTVPPGSLGIPVNGEMSIIQAGHCSGGPNTL